MSSGAKKVVMGKKKLVAKAPTSSAPKIKRPALRQTFQHKHAHLFSKKPFNFGIGRHVRPTLDLSRYVRWPRYIRLQRQRAILKKRLKVPPAINQFSKTLDKNQASTLFRLLAHYRPESKPEKVKRLKLVAETQVKNEKSGAAPEPKQTTKPLFVKYGLNHVTQLIEEKKQN